MILLVTFGVANANSDCTVKQYIQNYYSENFQENIDLEFEKVTVQDTEKKNELWVLTGDLLEYDIFDNKIEKVSNPYVVQTKERYYITLQSEKGNILYLCITKKGEMFFGRYADYDKPNYCEYLVNEADVAAAQLSQI